MATGRRRQLLLSSANVTEISALIMRRENNNYHVASCRTCLLAVALTVRVTYCTSVNGDRIESSTGSVLCQRRLLQPGVTHRPTPTPAGPVTRIALSLHHCRAITGGSRTCYLVE